MARWLQVANTAKLLKKGYAWKLDDPGTSWHTDEGLDADEEPDPSCNTVL